MIIRADGSFEHLPEGDLAFEKLKEALGGGDIGYARAHGLEPPRHFGFSRDKVSSFVHRIENLWFYCDDNGLAKKLPLNVCGCMVYGLDTSPVVGDIVLVGEGHTEDPVILPLHEQELIRAWLEEQQQLLYEKIGYAGEA